MASVVEKSPNAEPGYRRLATHWRVILSVVLLVHLTAVIAAPWSGPDGANPAASVVVRPFGPYLDAAYLGHGYRFFAPEPGPGHIIRYELELADGKSQVGTFPDLNTERPRLFYHRHFMLTEKLDGFRVRGDLPADAPPEVKQSWEAGRNLFNQIARSYANHLLHETGARTVKLELVEHNLPMLDRVLQGQKLTDPQLY